MPAGVSWGQYLKFFASAMLSMMAGAQVVHMYYKPLEEGPNDDVKQENEDPPTVLKEKK